MRKELRNFSLGNGESDPCLNDDDATLQEGDQEARKDQQPFRSLTAVIM